MKVFISWSGERSRTVASLLAEWLPDVIGGLKTFVSDTDIDKGTRWQTVIAHELDVATFGIVCITRDRINAPWLNFEAGALSRRYQTSETQVATLLLDITNPGEVPQPLAQFNATVATKDEIFKLVKSINKSMGEEAAEPDRLLRLFDRGWPEMSAVLQAVSEASGATDETNQSDPVLTEILSIVRELQRTNATDTALAAAEILGLAEKYSGVRAPEPLPRRLIEPSEPVTVRFAEGVRSRGFLTPVPEVGQGRVTSAPEARIRIIRKAIDRVSPTLGLDEETVKNIRIAWLDPEDIEIQLPDEIFVDGGTLSAFIYSLEGIVPGQHITYKGISNGAVETLLAELQLVRDSLVATLDSEGLSVAALRPGHLNAEAIEVIAPSEIHISVYAKAAANLFIAVPTAKVIQFVLPNGQVVGRHESPSAPNAPQ